MSHDARKTPPAIAESGVRDLRSQLLEQRKNLEALQRRNTSLADELDDVTVRLLRAEAELAGAKEREAESARQWLAMSADLAATRAHAAKSGRLLERVTEMLGALNDRARGSVVESEIDAIVGVLELHSPDRGD
jgi:chromosome segregation ATPase